MGRSFASYCGQYDDDEHVRGAPGQSQERWMRASTNILQLDENDPRMIVITGYNEQITKSLAPGTYWARKFCARTQSWPLIVFRLR